jgi:hypothetical protein
MKKKQKKKRRFTNNPRSTCNPQQEARKKNITAQRTPENMQAALPI